MLQKQTNPDLTLFDVNIWPEKFSILFLDLVQNDLKFLLYFKPLSPAIFPVCKSEKQSI